MYRFTARKMRFHFRKPRDCYEILNYFGQSTNGIYQIYVGVAETPVKVYCDQETDGGGWTVISYTSFNNGQCWGVTRYKSNALL